MCFRNRWEGRCDGGCPYWICGKEQQYYSIWLKRTKGLFTFSRSGGYKTKETYPTNSWIACFAGCFRHSQNQLYNSPLQICIAGRTHFSKKTKKNSKRHLLFKLEKKKTGEEKIYRWTEFFTSWTITSEKCTRAHVQENKSIYLSIYLTIWKPFWKRVYICINSKTFFGESREA